MASTYRDQLKHIRRAARVLDELKTSRGCVDCGFNAWPEALHFDHIHPGTKANEPGWVRDRSKLTSARRLASYVDHVMEFCVIRCANCHAHRSKAEQHWQWRSNPTAANEHPTLF